LDSNSRKGLAIAKTLVKSGYDVHIGNDDIHTIPFKSKYLKKHLKYRSLETDEGIKDLVNYIKKNNIDILLPLEESTIEIIYDNYDSLKSVSKIPIPKKEVFELARDKFKTVEFLEKVGINFPKSIIIQEISEIDKLELEYPVVIKPRKSSGSRGITYVNSKEELKEKYVKVNEIYSSPMIQEFIPQNGNKYQILMLIDKEQNLKAKISQQLLRQYPINGGPGTFWKSISLPELEEKSYKLLKEMNWYGVACVEFITNPKNGKAYFMEINPRFWGTIHLSNYLGINFPDKLVKTELNIEYEEKYNEKEDYYCQWGFPGDFLNFLMGGKKFYNEYGYFFKKPDKITYAIWDKKDIKPFIFNILYSIKDLFSIKKLKDAFKRSV